MSTEVKKFSPRGCLRKIVFFTKIIIILAILIGSGVVGALIANRVAQDSFSKERDGIRATEQRVVSLVEAINKLEQDNNQLLIDNQKLKEQLKSEEDKRKEEERKKQLNFTVKELGRRLMSFQLEKPVFYFEFDKNFEQAKVESYPAEFAKDVVAEGIEVRFTKSPIVITIEPWKFSGRGLQEVQSFTVTTADGKEARVSVTKDDKDNFTVTGMIVSGDKQDSVKLMVTATTDKATQATVTEQIRDILRSVELDLKTL